MTDNSIINNNATTNNHPSRRDFLRISGLAAIAASIPAPLLSAVAQATGYEAVTPMPIAAAATLPWEINASVLAGKDVAADSVIKLGKQFLSAAGKQIKHEFPVIFADETGTPWVAYTSYPDMETEQLVLSPLAGNALGATQQVSPEADKSAIMAQVVLTEGAKFAMVWASFIAPGDWAIKAAVNGKMYERLNAPGTIGMHPTVAVDASGTVCVAWEESAGAGNATRIMFSALKKDADAWTAPVSLTAHHSGDCRRPALAPANVFIAYADAVSGSSPNPVLTTGGDVWVAYDSYTDQFAVNIFLTRYSFAKEKIMHETQITHGPGLNVASALSVDAKGQPWLAWHSNVTPEGKISVSRWFRLVTRTADGKILEPNKIPLGCDFEVHGEVQGFEFPKVYCTPDNRVWITGRASQNFLIQNFGSDGWSELVRLPKDGWGGRGQTLELAVTKDGKFWSARRDLQNLVVQELIPAPAKVTTGELPLAPFVWPDVKPTMLKKPKFDAHGEYNFYFGDIHGHTWHSDGTSDVDEYFLMRRDFYAEDFCSLTDHDDFVGNALSPAEFEMMKEFTEHYNKPGTFATIYGLEWTSGRPPTGDGHHNIYSLKRELPMYDHFVEKHDRLGKFREELRAAGQIAIPHHVGWTGTNWDEFDNEITPVIEIVSVHGAYEYFGNKPIMHRAGDRTKKWFAQDGWAMGKKYGVIGSTDCHGLKYQHGVCWKEDPFRAGWAAVIAKDLTPEAILDALKKRRCYATSGIFMRIELDMNGRMMGEEFTLAKDEIPTLKLDLSAESTIEWVEIVRNNEVVYSTGGNGRRHTVAWKDDAPLTDRESWYYIRVTCSDGNMAWTSPVWIKYS